MTFKGYYNKLQMDDPQKKFREEVMRHCNISKSTFYNWMENPSTIPLPAKVIIASLAGHNVDELFPLNNHKIRSHG